MKHTLSLVASLTLAALVVGCASPKAGSDDTTYYYSNKNAPTVAPVRAAPVAPPVAENGPVGVARIVYFDFDKYVVKPEYRNVVEAHANYLKSRRGSKVVLEGHADERGGREYNLALGQRRSEAVRRSLLLLGVPESQLEAISWGTEKPASQERTEAGYQLNRRVEFSYR